MGKKGAKGKGKPVVMTQAEFFSSAQNTNKQDEGDWGKASAFLGGAQPKTKVVVADKKQEETDLMKALVESQQQQQPAAVEENVQEPKVQKSVTQHNQIEEKKTTQQSSEQPKPKEEVAKPSQKQPEAQPKVQAPQAPPAYNPFSTQSVAGSKAFNPVKGPPPKPLPGMTQLPKTFQPPQMPLPYNPQGPQPQHAGQRQVDFKTSGAMREKKPDSYEDAMKLFAFKSELEENKKKKKQPAANNAPQGKKQQIPTQKNQDYGQEQYGDEEYYDEYGMEGADELLQEVDPELVQGMLSDPSQIAMMLGGMAQNPNFQAQLNPNQLSMLMDPNQAEFLSSAISNLSMQGLGNVQNFIQFQPGMMPMPQSAQPQMVSVGGSGGFIPPPMRPAPQNYEDEYDPEVDNIDDIIQQNLFNDQHQEDDSRFAQLQKARETQHTKKIFDGISKKELAEMEDDDAIIDLFLKNPDRFTVCEYFKRGNCRYGDTCRYYHPANLNEDDYYDEEEEKPKKRKFALDDECCICLEKVLANNRQFGILDNCDHTFCLKCIRGWRSTYDKRNSKHHFRTCPICRRNSYLVVPSDHVVKSGPEKDELIEEYKEVLKNIPCKHFNRGKGMCPFMNSCLYAHLLSNGTPYEYPWKDTKLNEYGEWEDDRDLTLAERFGNFNV